MPLNDRKVISIIIDECDSIEERCDGYKEELCEVIAEIIAAERQHRVQGTQIQKKINEKCNATADFLSRNRD
ncbi:MAG: hypothetical protein OXM61_13200 [Candidatus Poribacteria bacterium]|nr:hypothetical protein [Candidatus Poribacteria bacterium]